ncbi:MAG: hypothetical protein JXA30_11675 [Deltaproteobacteria bacterium]|nr:hypothetical protein [Deltaproteobacteria bacterium]
MNDLTNISQTQLEGEYRTVGLFIDNAKTYVQLATGALLLSVTFSKELTNSPTIPMTDVYLLVPWICWLIAILAGATYQYCAAKYLEELEQKNGSLYNGRVEVFVILRYWVSNPYQLYGALMFLFYIGTLWFVITAICQLMGRVP